MLARRPIQVLLNTLFELCWHSATPARNTIQVEYKHLSEVGVATVLSRVVTWPNHVS